MSNQFSQTRAYSCPACSRIPLGADAIIERPDTWQTLLGLAPAVAQRAPSPPMMNGFCSDDDLGFDPYAESSKVR